MMCNMITRMNSDNLAKAAALALVVIKLVLSWDKMSGAHWAFYLLWALLFWGLFQGLRPVADVVTGKSYIRGWWYGIDYKTPKSKPFEYCIELLFSVISVIVGLYMMFRFIP